VKFGGGLWLRFLRAYAVTSLALHLAWEIVQLPLYAIWSRGSPAEIVWAVLHCTVGDVLIALGALVAAVLLLGDLQWPRGGALQVAAAAFAFGVGYTVYSEWLNTSVRAAWAYAEAMPVLPPFGTGLTPLLQWLVVPPLALWLTQRRMSDAD